MRCDIKWKLVSSPNTQELAAIIAFNSLRKPAMAIITEQAPKQILGKNENHKQIAQVGKLKNCQRISHSQL
jgi:hypothetical protein